jgi:LAO/AO transport system kinase
LTGSNLDEAWKISDEFFRHNTSNGWIEKNRHSRDIDWMKETLNELILAGFYSQQGFEGSLNTIKEAVLTQKLSAFEAAEAMYLKFGKIN